MPSTTSCTTSRNGRSRIRALKDLLLDAPQMMGVESIELDTVNLRMVARTLPGKQYEVGRRIRVLVVRALRRAGIVASDGNAPMVAAIPHSSELSAGEEAETQAAPEQKQ